VPGVGWVAAKDLNVGTYLQTKTESWLDIDKIESHTSPTNVYNFEVEGFHTYFVSDLGFLVHNSCRDVKPLPELDSTGKVHGELPKPQDLGKYPKEDLAQLRNELEKSAQERIRKNVELGSDKPHGQRQGQEQDLIKSIDKFLNNKN
jgi:Pretoxin HINT domain